MLARIVRKLVVAMWNCRAERIALMPLTGFKTQNPVYLLHSCSELKMRNASEDVWCTDRLRRPLMGTIGIPFESKCEDRVENLRRGLHSYGTLSIRGPEHVL